MDDDVTMHVQKGAGQQNQQTRMGNREEIHVVIGKGSQAKPVHMGRNITNLGEAIQQTRLTWSVCTGGT